jgi:multimeric flavodoxin WrbA
MKPSRIRQLLLYAGPFPALAFFKTWAATGPDPGSLAVVAWLMFLFCAMVIFVAYRWDKPSYFDWTVAFYFGLVSLSLAAWPQSASGILSRYSVTAIYACLFTAAFFPPLLGMDPFTSHYAKKVAPEPVWNNPVFVRINLIMTYTWAGVFALAAVLSLYPSVVSRALIPLAIILGFGLPFNVRFPDFYLRRVGLPGLREMRKMMSESRVSSRTALHASGTEASGPGEVRPTAAADTEGRSVQPMSPDIGRKEHPMRVLALNSSPRGEGESKTGLMLNHLVQGMREAGADVEIVELRKKTIKHCAGCFTCWTKTPGVCIHKDDMSGELFPKLLKSDLVVYATPLYHFHVNATMKAFIERTLPILEPFLEEGEDATKHPVRQEFPKAVLLSVAGFPERSVFDQLSSWARFIFGRNDNLVAEIYRPAAESMTMPFCKDKAEEVLEATRRAGREIVRTMTVSEATMAVVTQDMATDKQVMRTMANLFWKSCIAEGVSPREFLEKGLVPRPDSIETLIMVLSYAFNPAGAGDTKAVLQFDFSGSVRGSCRFRIEDGKITGSPGPAEKPDLVIESPFDVWVDIMTGKADGQQMFMTQKYKAKGDLSLLMRMGQLFGKRE